MTSSGIIPRAGAATPQAMVWEGDSISLAIAGNWPSQTTVWSESGAGSSTLLTLTLPALTQFTHDGNQADCTYSLTACPLLQSIDISNCSAQTSFSTAGLASLTSFVAEECFALVSLPLGDSVALKTLDLNDCTSFVTIDLSSNDVIENISCNGCTLLTTITLGSTNLKSVGCQNSAINAATINALLVACVTAGNTNGLFDTSGGTSAAPSGAGLTAKATLLTRGWTVTTN